MAVLSGAIAALALAFVAGCTGSVAQAPANAIGVPRFVGPGMEGSPLLDFGAAFIGSQVDRALILRNDGTRPFTLLGVEGSPGLSPSFVFSQDAVEVRAGQQIAFGVSFRPTEAGPLAGSLTFRFANGDTPEAIVSLKGVGVAQDCDVSASDLDFGAVVRGTSYPLSLFLLNRAPIASQVVIDAPTADGGGIGFAFPGSFAAGAHEVPAASAEATPGRLEVPLEFTPTRTGEYAAQLAIHWATCSASIALRGVGLDRALECGPSTRADGVEACGIDFGFVQPGITALRQVTFTNRGNDDLELALAPVDQASAGAPFAIATSETSFVVRGHGGTRTVDVSFHPNQPGQQVGSFGYRLAGAAQPYGSVTLTGVGGGPRIEIDPLQVDFGRIAVDQVTVRLVHMANAGTDAFPGLEDNLQLAVRNGDVWLLKPPEVIGADAADFTPGLVFGDYTDAGLAAGQSVNWAVFFEPHSAGTKHATLVFYSNDPESPQVQVPLTGIAVSLPPCDLEVSPAALNFGSLEVAQTLRLSFSLVNRDPDPTHECIVTVIAIPGGGGVNAFSLADGGIAQATLPGGESLRVPIIFHPHSTGALSDSVRILISNPTTPFVDVPLSGVAETSCIMVAPREAVFGTNGLNCTSPRQSITIYNGCTSSQTLNAIALQAPSSEFTLVGKPNLPSTLNRYASVEFGVTYHPAAVGEHAAAVAVTFANNPTPLVVSLQGSGAVDPVETEVFSSVGPPKVDLLLIVDNGSSDSDKQASLARNYAAMMEYAIRANVDYHIAVTSDSLDSPTYECGRFVPLTGTSARVITPSTPNAASVFTQKVSLGTSGSGTESLIRPAYLALTNPLLTGHNAGFYRDDAKLSILTQADAADQDPLSTPVEFYETWLFSLKGLRRRNDVTFNGIIPLLPTQPPYSGCSYDSSDAGQSPRVRQIVRDTAGLTEEICSPDWTSGMRRLGQRMFGVRTTFFLLNTPDMTRTDPIAITLDGQPFAQYASGGIKRWEYDAARNAVEFSPTAAIEPTQVLTISYRVACLP